MDWPELFLKGLQIVFLNLVLSGDNVGIIALAIQDLPRRKAKWANLLGGSAAMLLRILFIAMLGAILSLRFLHLHLAGGLLLLLITYRMAAGAKRVGSGHEVSGGSLPKAIASIVAADLSMSFDNALAVASVVMTGGGRLDNQKMTLVAVGLLACVPVIFWGGKVVAGLMERHPAVIHLCTGILVFTAVTMIFEDDLLNVSAYSGIIGKICGFVCGALAFAYGMLSVKEKRLQQFQFGMGERKRERVWRGKDEPHVHTCRIPCGEDIAPRNAGR